MSKSNIDKQVYEQYVDATVALFMEHYAVALTDTISREDRSVAPYPEKLDERCLGIIKKECAKQRSRKVLKSAKRVLSSAAVLLIVLLSLSSVLFITVEAFRVPVINFFIEQGDGFWAITGTNNDDPIDPIASNGFDPNDPLAGLLPAEYSLIDVKNGKNNARILTYSTSDGKEALFWIRTDISDITVDSENASASYKCDIAGCEGVFVLKDGLAHLSWIDRIENISYYLSADVADKDMLFSVANQFMKNLSK